MYIFLGLRSKMGAGFSRINDLTIIQATQVKIMHNRVFYSLQCEYSNLGTLEKWTNQNVIWVQRIATFFVNGPMAITNANNTSFITKFENLWTFQNFRIESNQSEQRYVSWEVGNYLQHSQVFPITPITIKGLLGTTTILLVCFYF